MSREECESYIIIQLQNIWAMYRRYHPDGDGLNLRVSENGVFAWNAYRENGKDKDFPIDIRIMEDKEDENEN